MAEKIFKIVKVYVCLKKKFVQLSWVYENIIIIVYFFMYTFGGFLVFSKEMVKKWLRGLMFKF